MTPPPRPSSPSPSPSPNSSSSSETPPQPTLKQRAEIKTHHCRFCSHLLLATTQDLASLPRRREPGADRAIILPLPVGGDDEDEDDEEEGEGEEGGNEEGNGEGEEESSTAAIDKDKNKDKNKDGDGDGEKGKGKQQPPSESESQKRLRLLRKHYTILLSTTLPDRKHTVIRREDGFEKRLLLRCGRCRVVVGYVLDEEAHGGKVKGKEEKGDAGEGEGDGEEKEKAKVVYILPGSLVGTEDMGSEVKVEKEEWAKWIKS